MNQHDETITGLVTLGLRQVQRRQGCSLTEWWSGFGPRSFLVGKRSLRACYDGKSRHSYSLTGFGIHRCIREIGRRAAEFPTPHDARRAFRNLMAGQTGSVERWLGEVLVNEP